LVVLDAANLKAKPGGPGRTSELENLAGENLFVVTDESLQGHQSVLNISSQVRNSSCYWSCGWTVVVHLI